jgi:hypothetical protein
MHGSDYPRLARRACAAALRIGQAPSLPAYPPASLPANCPHPMEDDLPPLPATPTGLYRHYKGGRYEVIGAARHSETLEPLVVYRPLYGAGSLWVRPHAMFFGQLLLDGKPVQRFTPLTD